MRIGVIADTHGLLRPEAVTALAGVDHILHLGDVGDPDILARLNAQSSKFNAIRGNVDTEGQCALLPETEVVEANGLLIYMLHNADTLDLNPKASGFAAVLFGHTHRPTIEWRGGVLFFNPGSAGPRRFKLPVTVGSLEITDGQITPTILTIA